MKDKIILKDITKEYGKANTRVVAADSVNIELNKGESMAILGASGSGKSTLLQIIGGLTVPTSGHVSVFGNKIDEMNDDELSDYRNSTIGFVFQSFNLQSYLTAAENVATPLLIRGLDRTTAIKEASEILDQIGLKERKTHKPAEMSGGEMQRVAIARALASKPSIILADEPSGNLDKKSTESVMKLFKEVESWGITVIVVTHDPRIANEFDRTIEMDNGEIISDSKKAKKVKKTSKKPASKKKSTTKKKSK